MPALFTNAAAQPVAYTPLDGTPFHPLEGDAVGPSAPYSLTGGWEAVDIGGGELEVMPVGGSVAAFALHRAATVLTLSGVLLLRASGEPPAALRLQFVLGAYTHAGGTWQFTDPVEVELSTAVAAHELDVALGGLGPLPAAEAGLVSIRFAPVLPETAEAAFDVDAIWLPASLNLEA